MAGDAGRLEVVVQGPERAGPLRVQVLVVTDARRRDPVHGKAITRIPIDGWVGRRLRAHPETLALGRRTLEARLERLIDVVAIPGLARDDVRATLHGLEGGVTLANPVVRGRGGWTARVVVQVPSLAGPFAGRLRFEVAGDEPLAIPIEGEAVRPGAEPPRRKSSAKLPDPRRGPRAR
jgi:hypothetical protein